MAVLDVDGGTVMLMSKLTVGSTATISNLVIGNCASGAVGVVNVDGGSLYVTNAAHDAVLDVRDGQLILNSGLLQIDKLVMTNVCGLFIPQWRNAVDLEVRCWGQNVDADGDGMPNGWEQTYGFDPLLLPTLAWTVDGDGSSNLQEFLSGTTRPIMLPASDYINRSGKETMFALLGQS